MRNRPAASRSPRPPRGRPRGPRPASHRSKRPAPERRRTKPGHVSTRFAPELAEALVAFSQDALLVVDGSGRILQFNEAYCRISGSTRAQVAGLCLENIGIDRSRPELARLREGLRPGRDRLECILPRPGRPGVQVDVCIAPAPQPGLYLVSIRDITERKRSEDMLAAQRDAGVSLSLTSDLHAGLSRLLQILVRFEGVDSGGVYLLDPDTGALVLAAHRGLSVNFVRQVARYGPDSPQTRLIQERRAAYLSGASLSRLLTSVLRFEGLRALATFPLVHEGKVMGVLNVASHNARHIPPQTLGMAETIATQAAGAIARIFTESQRRILEAQLLEITEREHARIGQDIHDGLCQQLVSLAFDANTVCRDLAQAAGAESSVARRLTQSLDEAITEARRLARGLFPVRLETEGLPPALEELARSLGERYGLKCSFSQLGTPKITSRGAAIHLYRIAQEAASNAIKHANATAIEIALRAAPGGLELSVSDNGQGIDLERAADSLGMGLHIMRYRAKTLGGSLELRKAGPKGGTLLVCRVPAISR